MEALKRVLITGGTGLIGTKLTLQLLEQGWIITVLSRDPEKVKKLFTSKVESLQSLSQLKTLDDFDAVINLAGESLVNKRWSTQQKQRIQDSRWEMTQQLSDLCLASLQAPAVFISGSAIGFYGSQPGVTITEQSPPLEDYLHQLCDGWEKRAILAQSAGTRVCLLRTSLVLASHGGVLAKLLPLFKCGLGGKLGSGRQRMSWIHIDDMVAAIVYLLNHEELEGAFNLCAPEPVSNAQFTQVLATALRRPAIFSVPLVALKLFFGEMATVIMADQSIIPARLSASGFHFRYPTLSSAVKEIVTSNHSGHDSSRTC